MVEDIYFQYCSRRLRPYLSHWVVFFKTIKLNLPSLTN